MRSRWAGIAGHDCGPARRVCHSGERILGTYLKDQLALGVLWRELARRAQRNNRGTSLGEALEHVATGIAEDVETFRSIMRRLGIRPNPVKVVAALGGERLERLKLNGRLRQYSPLSRFEELEFLTMGIDGKKQMWTTLRDLAGLAARLPDVDFDDLVERAQWQRSELEAFRDRRARRGHARVTSGVCAWQLATFTGVPFSRDPAHDVGLAAVAEWCCRQELVSSPNGGRRLPARR